MPKGYRDDETIKRIIAQCFRVCIVGSALAFATSVDALSDEARSAYQREDYETAARLLKPQAERGDAEAQYRLGMMARFGWGIDKDNEAAARWFRKAAEQGHAQAQAELGNLYRLGRGVPEDPKEAARWLRAAAASGVGIAQLSIGRMYRDGIGVPVDRVEAYAWFTAAGDNNVMDGLAYRSELIQSMSPDEIARGKQLAAQRSKKEVDPK